MMHFPTSQGNAFVREAWLIAVGLIVLQAVLLIWGLEREYNQTLKSQYSQLADAARIADEHIAGSMRVVDLMLGDIAADIRSQASQDVADTSPHIAMWQRVLPEVRTILVTNANGSIFVTTRPEIQGWDVHDREYFSSVLANPDPGRTIFGSLTRVKLNNALVIFASRAISSPAGKLIGVVAASLDIGVFHPLMASLRPDDADSAILIADRRGSVISRAPFPERFVGFDISKGSLFERHLSSGEKVSFHRLLTVTDGVEKIGVARTVADGAFVLIVTKPVTVALASWWTLAVTLGALFLVMSIAVVVLTGFAINRHRRLAETVVALENQQRRLVESERFSNAIASNLPGMVGYWDADLCCRFANSQYREWFGKTSEELVGASLREVLGERLFTLNEPYIRGALSGEKQTFERTLFRPGGEEGYMLVRYIPDMDEQGGTKGFFVLATDVTTLKRHEIQLVEAKAVAEAANSAKSFFIATMSHELRTPLNAIIGFSEIAVAETYGPIGDGRYVENARDIGDSAQHLLKLINDILDLSKIEAGKVELEFSRLDAVVVARQVTRMLKEVSARAGIELVTAFPSEPAVVWADERALRQMLMNLLSNAIKFTPPKGTVSLTVSDGTGLGADFIVTDTGRGIPPGDMDRILKPFEQVDNRYSRPAGGSGLGLSIVQGLAKLHGGSLRIESEVGKGTQVTIRIPDLNP